MTAATALGALALRRAPRRSCSQPAATAIGVLPAGPRRPRSTPASAALGVALHAGRRGPRPSLQLGLRRMEQACRGALHGGGGPWELRGGAGGAEGWRGGAEGGPKGVARRAGWGVGAGTFFFIGLVIGVLLLTWDVPKGKV